jgi:predicted nucleic acid-binding protein
MSGTALQEVLLDTSVLINFLRIGRLGLLARHPRYRFTVTDHVRAEIREHYPEQLALLEGAFNSGEITEIHVTDLSELEVFARLSASGQLGAGECSAIAVAANRRLALAIDDRAARRHANQFNPPIPLLDTEVLIVTLIQERALNIAEADAIKADWEQNHRFRLPFQSFRERI